MVAYLQHCQCLLMTVGVHGVQLQEGAQVFERLSHGALLHQLQQCAVDISDLLDVAKQLGMHLFRQYAVEAKGKVKVLKNKTKEPPTYNQY